MGSNRKVITKNVKASSESGSPFQKMNIVEMSNLLANEILRIINADELCKVFSLMKILWLTS